MIAFKQLLSSDVIVTPLEVNKAFTFSGSQLIASTVGIDRFQGTNINSNPWISGSNPTTGYISIQDQQLVYDSIKQLYYSNYISSSYGDILNTSSLIPGANISGNISTGTPQSPGLYDNYLQTTLTFKKFFPTGSNDVIGVISIPSRLYGDFIQPSSLILQSASIKLQDDGEGNVIVSGSTQIIGNIYYGQGMITLTGYPTQTPNLGGYGYGIYGTTTYGSGTANTNALVLGFINNPITCSFSSSLTIYENQYKCTIRENEFTYTLNPTLQTDQSGSLPGYTTGSYWSPYITTVGLYDEAQNLLAIGKLAQPLPTSPTTDTTILVNIDM